MPLQHLACSPLQGLSPAALAALSASPDAAILSFASLGVGTWAVHQSNIFHTLTVDTISPFYIIASLLCPIAWGAWATGMSVQSLSTGSQHAICKLLHVLLW